MDKPLFVGQRVMTRMANPLAPRTYLLRPGVVRRIGAVGILVAHTDGEQPPERNYRPDEVQAIAPFGPFGFPFEGGMP